MNRRPKTITVWTVVGHYIVGMAIAFAICCSLAMLLNHFNVTIRLSH